MSEVTLLYLAGGLLSGIASGTLAAKAGMSWVGVIVVGQCFLWAIIAISKAASHV